jgi:hypothetical protein
MKRILSSKRDHYLARVSIFLITVALIAGMVGCVYAPPPSQNLEIRTWYDLDAVRDNLGGSYLLMNDLDSTTAGYEELASPTANAGMGWQPIGTWADRFTGSFDGGGYEIRDLFINRPDDEYCVGLFGCVDVGSGIKNLGVVNVVVTGRLHNVGGLVGTNWGTVSNCYSTGNVTGDVGVGGLVGWNEAGTVNNSYSTASVTGEDEHVGGLAGGNGGTVSNSYSTGSVSGSDQVGGLVGGNYRIVSNSYSTGNVTGDLYVGGLVGLNYFSTVDNSYSSGNVTGVDYVAGLVGINWGTVSNSYSSGNVTGDWLVGGLVGENLGTVSNSYSTSSVTGDVNVGGLVGINWGTVSNSYSTGSVTGNSSVGGLVGLNHGGTVSNSFWDTETSGQATSAGGTGKTTAEMQDIATFSGAGWNIIAVASGKTNDAYTWNIVDDETYPFLSWQS